MRAEQKESKRDRAARTLKAAPDGVRYAMNAFVIACGTYVAALGQPAIATARKLGRVEIDLGDTACKVPEAESYIMKSRRRRPGGAEAQDHALLNGRPPGCLIDGQSVESSTVKNSAYRGSVADQGSAFPNRSPAPLDHLLVPGGKSTRQQVNNDFPVRQVTGLSSAGSTGRPCSRIRCSL